MVSRWITARGLSPKLSDERLERGIFGRKRPQVKAVKCGRWSISSRGPQQSNSARNPQILLPVLARDQNLVGQKGGVLIKRNGGRGHSRMVIRMIVGSLGSGRSLHEDFSNMRQCSMSSAILPYYNIQPPISVDNQPKFIK